MARSVGRGGASMLSECIPRPESPGVHQPGSALNPILLVFKEAHYIGMSERITGH